MPQLNPSAAPDDVDRTTPDDSLEIRATTSDRPRVEILKVRRINVAGSGILDFVIDAPVGRGPSGSPCTTTATHVLPLQGWVLGTTEPVRELIIHEQGCDVRRIPLNNDRPDVLAAYPSAPPQI